MEASISNNLMGVTMFDFFKKAEAAYTIAKEVKPCVKAFKAKDYVHNQVKAIDLAVLISKKLEGS